MNALLRAFTLFLDPLWPHAESTTEEYIDLLLIHHFIQSIHVSCENRKCARMHFKLSNRCQITPTFLASQTSLDLCVSSFCRMNCLCAYVASSQYSNIYGAHKLSEEVPITPRSIGKESWGDGSLSKFFCPIENFENKNYFGLYMS